jgi:predicted transcriptional regulator
VVRLGLSSAKLCNYSPDEEEEDSPLELLQFKSFDDLSGVLTDGRLTLKIAIYALSSTVCKQIKEWIEQQKSQ